MKEVINKIREIKKQHDKEVIRVYKLKTKPAIRKSQDRIQALSFELCDMLDTIMPNKLKLVSDLYCSPITGGGSAIPKGCLIEFDGCAYSGIFYCQETVFRTDFCSLGWSKTALECILNSIESRCNKLNWFYLIKILI